MPPAPAGLADLDVPRSLRGVGAARRNFNANKSRLVEGEDFFKVGASEFRTHLDPSLSKFANEDVVVLTESGYLMLVKSLTDDLAWSVQRDLVCLASLQFLTWQRGINRPGKPLKRRSSYTLILPARRLVPDPRTLCQSALSRLAWNYRRPVRCLRLLAIRCTRVSCWCSCRVLSPHGVGVCRRTRRARGLVSWYLPSRGALYDPFPFGTWGRVCYAGGRDGGQRVSLRWGIDCPVAVLFTRPPLLRREHEKAPWFPRSTCAAGHSRTGSGERGNQGALGRRLPFCPPHKLNSLDPTSRLAGLQEVPRCLAEAVCHYPTESGGFTQCVTMKPLDSSMATCVWPPPLQFETGCSNFVEPIRSATLPS